MLGNQKVLPAISTMKEFEKYLKSDLEWCILMDFHISLLEIMVKQAHDVNKKILIHIDLMKGVTSDEFGCEYCCQKMKVDGVISTKSKVIDAAKRNKKVAIQRMFLIDSKSLEKGLNQLMVSAPDYIEVLPGIAYAILPYIQSKINIPIISGGLIKDKDTIDECLKAGAVGVSIGDLNMAMEYTNK